MFREPGQRRRVTPAQAAQVAPRETRRLRQPGARRSRGQDLLAAVRGLDAGLDRAAREHLARWAREHYHCEFGDIPVGLVARCYLGPPYVDHRLDLLHEILEHYSPADLVPDPFGPARMLVRTGGYAYVEVYASGVLVPVYDDGTSAT